MVPAGAEVVLERDGVAVASWPLVCAGGRLDLGAVDALARLRLRAGRQGCTLRLRHAGPDLAELLELAGLAELLPLRQPARQAEGREQGGVEEAVVPDDPVA